MYMYIYTYTIFEKPIIENIWKIEKKIKPGYRLQLLQKRKKPNLCRSYKLNKNNKRS